MRYRERYYEQMGYSKLNNSLKHISNELKTTTRTLHVTKKKHWQNANLQQQQQQHRKCSVLLYDDDVTLFETKLETSDFKLAFHFSREKKYSKSRFTKYPLPPYYSSPSKSLWLTQNWCVLKVEPRLQDRRHGGSRGSDPGARA